MLNGTVKHLDSSNGWGFIQAQDGDDYFFNISNVRPGQKISFQFHNYRDEKWFAIKGKGLVYIEGKKLECKKGSSFEIIKGQKHSLENTGKLNLEIIEIQFGKKVIEEDIVRLKDIYGRV